MFDLLQLFQIGQALAFVCGVGLCTAAVGVLAFSRHSAASSVDQNALIAAGGWDCVLPPAGVQAALSMRTSPQTLPGSDGPTPIEWRLEPLRASSKPVAELDAGEEAA